MRYRTPAVLLVCALGGFALFAAPARSQTMTTQIVKGVTISNPNAVPKSKVDATLLVQNYAPVASQAYASLSWCDFNIVPTPTRVPGGTKWNLKPQVSNCKPATPSQTLLPRLSPRESGNIVVSNLVVPDACPVALVTRFGGGPASDLNNQSIAVTTPLHPPRASSGDVSVQSIRIEPDAKQPALRNITAEYSITLKSVPRFDGNAAVILEVCRAERCEVKVRQAPPSARSFKMAKEQVGTKLENRWVGSGTLKASFHSGGNDYFNGQPVNQVRVFVGSKKLDDYHIAEPRCESPNSVFTHTIN